MPELSRFFGIIIRMYYDDHSPPHFHAIYGNQEIQISIDPIAILNGKIPRRAISMVLEWTAMHQQELLENWYRVEVNRATMKIDPLE